MNLKKIKKSFTSDKRTSDRLFLPVTLAYSFQELPLDVSSPSWIQPIRLHDIGGDGLCFIEKDPIEEDAPLSIKLKLPNDQKPIMFTADVVWCKRCSEKNSPKNTFSIGILFHKMNYTDRRKFVSYISDNILLEHINYIEHEHTT